MLVSIPGRRLHGNQRPRYQIEAHGTVVPKIYTYKTWILFVCLFVCLFAFSEATKSPRLMKFWLIWANLDHYTTALFSKFLFSRGSPNGPVLKYVLVFFCVFFLNSAISTHKTMTFWQSEYFKTKKKCWKKIILNLMMSFGLNIAGTSYWRIRYITIFWNCYWKR